MATVPSLVELTKVFFDPNVVREAIDGMKDSSSAGPDSIAPWILKQTSDITTH